MPRIRSIHPGFWTDEVTLELSDKAPMAVLLLIGLWGDADDQGIFEWKPYTLKARILPTAAADVGALLDMLADLNAIRAFEVDGRRYGAIRNFRRYQRPKTPNAAHPMPPDFRNYVGLTAGVSEIGDDDDPPPPPKSETRRPQPDPIPPKAENSPQMEDGGGRMEGEGGQSGDSPPPPVATRIPPDWSPGPDGEAFAKSKGFEPDRIDEIAQSFRDYWTAKPGAAAKKLDWPATWRVWIAKELENVRQHGGRQHGGPRSGGGGGGGTAAEARRDRQRAGALASIGR